MTEAKQANVSKNVKRGLNSEVSTREEKCMHGCTTCWAFLVAFQALLCQHLIEYHGK